MKAPYIAEAEKLRVLHQMEYPDYKYRPKKRQKSGGQVQSINVTSSVKIEDRLEDLECPDTPVKRICHGLKQEPRTALVLDPPESPNSYTFPCQTLSLTPDYFSPELTPPPKVPSSPEMVRIFFKKVIFISLYLTKMHLLLNTVHFKAHALYINI